MKKQVTIQSFSGSKKELNELEIPQSLLNIEINKDLIHQVITAYVSSTHQGTKAQKTRSQVRGGGAKPWKQKGTGRARAGTTRGPIWRGGGVTFAAKSNQKTKKINKKMYNKAMIQIISHLLDTERLVFVDSIKIDEPKTKLLKNRLNSLKLENVCIVANEPNLNIQLASRNIPQVSFVTSNKLNPVQLLKHQHILMEQVAFQAITGGRSE